MAELRYKTESSFLRASKRYLASIKYKTIARDEHGKEIVNMLGAPLEIEQFAVPPNTLDWAAYLGINKQTLTQSYKQRYPRAYSEIKCEIEAYNARELMKRERVEGIKFNLINNFGWKDTRRLGLEEDTARAMTIASESELTLEDKLAKIEELKKDIAEL